MGINYLPTEVKCIVYADDTVLFVHSHSKDNVGVKLSKAMNPVTAWMQECSP